MIIILHTKHVRTRTRKNQPVNQTKFPAKTRNVTICGVKRKSVRPEPGQPSVFQISFFKRHSEESLGAQKLCSTRIRVMTRELKPNP